MIMREVLVLIGAGLVAGFSLALALANLVRSQLFGLNPRDPLTFIGSAVVLTLAAGLAGFLPALRAISFRRSGVRASARALPPFKPPRRPSSTAVESLSCPSLLNFDRFIKFFLCTISRPQISIECFTRKKKTLPVRSNRKANLTVHKEFINAAIATFRQLPRPGAGAAFPVEALLFFPVFFFIIISMDRAGKFSEPFSYQTEK